MENQQPTGEAQNSQKKEWYKNWWGVLIIIMLLPFFAIWYIWAKTKWNKAIKVLVTITIVIILIATAASDDKKNTDDTKTATTQKVENKENPTPTKQEQKAEPEITDPIKKIEANVKKTSDKFEITIWDSKGSLTKETTPPPYEVVVNAGNGIIVDCDSAKRISFDVMKNLYSDNLTKDKISRVLFTSWGNLRVSLGSEDGTKMDWSPAMAGPTNFWKVMMKFKSYEDENGSLSQRTWGKFIGSDCK